MLNEFAEYFRGKSMDELDLLAKSFSFGKLPIFKAGQMRDMKRLSRFRELSRKDEIERDPEKGCKGIRKGCLAEREIWESIADCIGRS